jgi:hypothetical protein
MTRHDLIATALKTADQWEMKGQPAWVEKCLSSALMTSLSLAVIDYRDHENGVAWLKARPVPEVLQRHQKVLETLVREVESKRLPSSVIGGNYHSLVFAHLAWCLEEYDLGKSYVAFSERDDVGELSTTFWREYAKGMGALIRGARYEPSEIKLRGQERYWSAYLQLIRAATSGETLDEAIAEIRNMFVKRNADKAIRDDAYQIEGSASQPAGWDFRCFGLLKFIRQ